MTLDMGVYATAPGDVVAHASRLVDDKSLSVETRLNAVRLIQLSLGDLMARSAKGTVWEGYSPRSLHLNKELVDAVLPVLRSTFPTATPDLDREISRTLAMVEDDSPVVLAKVAGMIDPTSDPVSDIHYLIVLARLRGPRSPAETKAVARALLCLDQKLAERRANRDRNWPLRISELYAELGRKDPQLHGALLSSPDFGRPDHALFALAAGFDRERAAEIFLEQARRDENYPWSAGLVDACWLSSRGTLAAGAARHLGQGGA